MVFSILLSDTQQDGEYHLKALPKFPSRPEWPELAWIGTGYGHLYGHQF